MTKRPTVAVLLFDRVNAIDVSGPAEAFACARPNGRESGYRTVFWSLDGSAVISESGLRLMPDGYAPARPRADLLVIPGGRGVRNPRTLSQLSDWLRSNHNRFERIASICTGAYALAAAGLLDGRKAATHWAHAEHLGACYPQLAVDADSLFVRDGKFYTSGGVTAGIDLALEIIAGDYGPRIAASVARELLVFVRRSGDQAQFSEPLRLQSNAPDDLAEVCVWAASHLNADLSVENLAERAGLSARQFTRRFKRSYGQSPGAYFKRLRVDAARALLSRGDSVTKAARAVGFASSDGFRRAFEAVLGISPGEYQKRFRTLEKDQ